MEKAVKVKDNIFLRAPLTASLHVILMHSEHNKSIKRTALNSERGANAHYNNKYISCQDHVRKRTATTVALSWRSSTFPHHRTPTITTTHQRRNQPQERWHRKQKQNKPLPRTRSSEVHASQPQTDIQGNAIKRRTIRAEGEENSCNLLLQQHRQPPHGGSFPSCS